MKLSDFLIDVGQPVPYYPTLSKVVGGIKPCILLCRLAWWSGLQHDVDGWIYKTQDEIEDETGLTAKEQVSAREELKHLELLEEKEDRLNHKKFYRICSDRLDELWEQNRVSGTPSWRLGNLQIANSSGGVSRTDQNGIRSDQVRTEETVHSIRKPKPILNTNTHEATVGSVATPKHWPKPYPTLEDVRFECVKIGIPESEAEPFLAHHEARDWMSGRTRITNWRRALVTWKINYFKFNHIQPSRPQCQPIVADHPSLSSIASKHDRKPHPTVVSSIPGTYIDNFCNAVDIETGEIVGIWDTIALKTVLK